MYSSLQHTTRDMPPYSDAAIPMSQKGSGLSTRMISTIVISLGLLLVTCIPRLLLAAQLDMVTDEGVYIEGGKIYVTLLAHLDIGAPGWLYNHEHPPLVKLLIGCSLWLNQVVGQPWTELFMARMPSVISGTLLVMAIYWLGQAPFGRVIALVAALGLAFSPWLSYFSALAYLDMTMAALVTCAYLSLWHAILRPQFYLLCAVCVSLGVASKYPAVLTIPAMFCFTAYCFFVIRPRLPVEQRPAIPWRWWIASMIVAPLVFFVVDPAIWPDPIQRLQSSFDFELLHASTGHLTFIAGQAVMHVPRWTIFYMLMVKISVFITIPAVFFVLFALVQQVRFYLRAPGIIIEEIVSNAFLLIWVSVTIGMFSLLTIVVGTHYYLPMAAPVVLAGTVGLAILLRYRRGHLFVPKMLPQVAGAERKVIFAKHAISVRNILVVALLMVVVMGPHLFGLITVPDAEGYSSEMFHGENSALQVAYPGYREALEWIAAKHQGSAHIGLVALTATLGISSGSGSSWYTYNQDFAKRFRLEEVLPNAKTYPYDYLIWPMHLVQRGYVIPATWRTHIVHTIMGGASTYCYILARPARVTDIRSSYNMRKN